MCVGNRLIMLVEDDESIRETLAELLKQEGYGVVLACNGKEALDCLRAGSHPCLILLDLMMPVMDGAAFRDQQLADTAINDIPVIMITAANRSLAMTVRCDAVLYKPIAIDTVLRTIQQLC